jgi:thiopurine S-methyltransferase
MSELDESFWTSRYREGNTGWDLGTVSPPIKMYLDGVDNKELNILIPGCGNAYEAEYLHSKGFNNVHVVDLSSEPLKGLLERVPSFPKDHVHQADFFEHTGEYDIIVEQTMFCAIDPSLRPRYAEQSARLLKEGGILVGVLFGRDFDAGPPFGGTKSEYLNYFSPYFSQIQIDPCYNSVEPRAGSELFIQLTK